MTQLPDKPIFYGFVEHAETSAVGNCFCFVCLFPIHTAQTFTMGPIVKLYASFFGRKRMVSFTEAGIMNNTIDAPE